MKVCNVCKIPKELDFFYRDKSIRSWFQGRCKECQRINSKKHYSNERQKEIYYNNHRRRLQWVYFSLLQRCNNPSSVRFASYWWRWIKCEWNSFDVFYNDLIELYNTHVSLHWIWRKNCQIDRINNEWNYCKSNVRFVTLKENQRNTSNNVRYEFNWWKYTIWEIVDMNLSENNYSTIKGRLNRWRSMYDAIYKEKKYMFREVPWSKKTKKDENEWLPF
jgi:hypothetical protein